MTQASHRARVSGRRGAVGLALAAVACLLLTPRAAAAWDWRSAFAVREGADITTVFELGASSVLPLSALPTDVHGMGGRISSSVTYVDDDKMATFHIGEADFFMVYRAQRNRYDAGSFPSLTLFNLSSQLRLTPGAHLIYGAGLARSGIMAHASSAALAFRLGFALPFFGRRARNMREYRRSYLQIETLPIAGSFLTNVLAEGYFDFEYPTIQLQAEVALVGRMETIIGTFSAETRLGASYVGQRSMALRIGLRWVGHTFWRRLAGVIESSYTAPLRPLRRHASDEAEELIYSHHLSLTIGILVYLGQPPDPLPHFTRERRRQHFEGRWELRRTERLERQEDRLERRMLRRAVRSLRHRRIRLLERREVRNSEHHQNGDVEERDPEEDEEEHEEEDED